MSTTTPDGGRFGSGGFARAVADAVEASSDSSAGYRYEHGTFEGLPNGVRLSGVEHYASSIDRAVTVAVREGGLVNLLDAGIDLIMPAQAARLLARALDRAADEADGSPPAGSV